MHADSNIIVWDWNGTLLDDTQLVFDSTNAVFAFLGKPPLTRAVFDAQHIIPLDNFYRRVGFTDAEIAKINAMSGEQDIFHQYYATHETTSGLRDGAKDVLGAVKASDMHSVILSNHIVDPIKALLQHHAIEPFFADVLAYPSRALQFKDGSKGDRLRRYLAAKNQTAPRGLIIGDTAEETEIGKSLGLVTVAITGGTIAESRLREANPDYVVHSLRELTPILQERGFAA